MKIKIEVKRRKKRIHPDPTAKKKHNKNGEIVTDTLKTIYLELVSHRWSCTSYDTFIYDDDDDDYDNDHDVAIEIYPKIER